MGCHSDSGFVHEVTGWSSQMLFGESFERPPAATKPGQSSYAWQTVVDAQVERLRAVADDVRVLHLFANTSKECTVVCTLAASRPSCRCARGVRVGADMGRWRRVAACSGVGVACASPGSRPSRNE